MDVGDLFKEAWPYAIVAAPGLWAVWKQWNGGKSLVTVAQDAAKGVIADLRAEVERLQHDVQALESELSLARKEHADTIAAKDAELTLMRGRLRQALANVDAYERLLTANNIPHEPTRQTFYRVEAGDYPTDIEPL